MSIIELYLCISILLYTYSSRDKTIGYTPSVNGGFLFERGIMVHLEGERTELVKEVESALNALIREGSWNVSAT